MLDRTFFHVDVETDEHFDLMLNLHICGLAKHFDDLLNDPRLILWITSQQTFISHPKIITLPLGLLEPRRTKFAMKRRTHVRRAIWVGNTVHTKSIPRQKIQKLVSSQLTKAGTSQPFFTTIPNIKFIAPNHLKWKTYWNFTSNSKFILSPPGSGFDCIRTWEALAMGAIPIVLHSTLDRMYAGLPVLLVDRYSDINMSMLKENYADFTKRADSWDFLRLTPSYWKEMIEHVIETGSAEIVQRNHPIPPKYLGKTIPVASDYAAVPLTHKTPKVW